MILFLVASPTVAEIVKEIKISGNKRISKETIFVLGKIEKNEDYSKERLNQTLKNLYDTNFFSNISLNLENGILKIDVIENPIIESVEIIGIKNKKVLENIYENISLKDRMSFSENFLNKDINYIKNLNKSLGYYFVKVEPWINKNDDLNSII